jgi:hypothetical protein
MPDYLTEDSLGKHNSELAAVHTIRVISHHKQSPILGLDMFNLFNQGSIERMAKNHYISHLKTKKQKGDFDNQDKIPFTIFRPQAFARNFDKPEH